MGSNDELEKIVDAAGEGRIGAAIHKIVPLDETAAAHEEMERSEHFGKFIIAVP